MSLGSICNSLALRAIIISIAGLLLLGVGLGALQPPSLKIVEAEGFILKSSTGKIQARLGVNDHAEVALELFDNDGKVRASMASDPIGASHFTVNDMNGNPRIMMIVTAEDESASIIVTDAKSQRAVTISVGNHPLSKRPVPQIEVLHSPASARIKLSLDKEEHPSIDILNKEGEEVIQVRTVGKNDEARIDVKKAN